MFLVGSELLLSVFGLGDVCGLEFKGSGLGVSGLGF